MLLLNLLALIVLNTSNGVGRFVRFHLKKLHESLITYLEKNEMDALLNAPDRSTDQGKRDYAHSCYFCIIPVLVQMKLLS